jgi:hypothetical protein
MHSWPGDIQPLGDSRQVVYPAQGEIAFLHSWVQFDPAISLRLLSQVHGVAAFERKIP